LDKEDGACTDRLDKGGMNNGLTIRDCATALLALTPAPGLVEGVSGQQLALQNASLRLSLALARGQASAVRFTDRVRGELPNRLNTVACDVLLRLPGCATSSSCSFI